MNNEEIVRLLRLVEEEVPVDRWVVDGVHVWPLFRSQLMGDNFFMYRRRAASAPARAGLLSRVPLGPLPKIAENAKAFARARMQDREAQGRIGEVDALLYSDGVSFLKLEGKYFERFCDPIRARLDERGLRSLMLTPLGRFLQPRYAPSVFVQPWLDVAQMAGLVSSRIWTRRRYELPGFADAIRIARAAFPDAVLRDEAHLGRGAAYIAAYQALHERILDRTRPRVVFMVSYYGSEAMALIRACRRRGIVTVDIEHGCINDAHWAYAHWSRVPEGGFDLLPRFFWVWGESEADTIRSWSDRTNGAHAPIVGGNLFLKAWNEGKLPIVASIDARLDELMRQVPAGLKHVMYTTNGYETEEQLGSLRDAISRSKGALYWWVRLHPVYPQSRPVVERALAGADGAFRIDAGDTPLYGTLRRMSAHVTESSSTVVEASELGVPTVLLAREESVMYQHLIDQGWASVLGEGEDLAKAVLARIGTQGRAMPKGSGVDPLDVVLASARG